MQVVVKVHGEIVEVEHIGSAHTDADLAVLLAAARARLHPGQQELDLGPLPEAVVSRTMWRTGPARPRTFLPQVVVWSGYRAVRRWWPAAGA